MSNKEKLLDTLNNMSDKELADAIDLPCVKCPAQTFCDNENPDERLTCQEIIESWLKEKENE